MHNKSIIFIIIFVFALAAIGNSAAIAKGQSSHPKMYQDLNDMSAILNDISAQRSSGKMTPEEQRTAAKITQGISHILQDLSDLGNEIDDKHQAEINKMKKSWDPLLRNRLRMIRITR